MNAPIETIHIDPYPTETAEWQDAFLALVAHAGPPRARFMLDELAPLARNHQIGWQPDLNTPYVNTIAAHAQPPFPGELAIEEKLASLMRWNALAMVVRANQAYGELGGHIASYASAADLFETGFNHFFHAREGLQHQDGSSHLVAATIPNCKAYDPAFAGEMAVIVDQGMREMLVEQQDVFYYVTLMNENYAQPDLPADAASGVIRGAYKFASYGPEGGRRVTLLGSGAILTEVIQAAQQLHAEGFWVDVISVTSWSELAREAAPDGEGHLRQLLLATGGPVVAATDDVRAVPESCRFCMPAGRSFTTLGTDGFGRSDTRAALRRFFQVDAGSIASTAKGRA